MVTNYKANMGIKTVSHFSYSTDLSPCDSWIIPKLKKKHRGIRFENMDYMKEAVTSTLDTNTLEDDKGVFQKWLERYKCIEDPTLRELNKCI